MSDWNQKITELEKEIQELKKVNSNLESKILQLEQNIHNSESNPHGPQSLIRRLNCWEFKMCGREPGGKNVCEFGVCPAAEAERLKGINKGTKGGRACWALVGTLCGGKVQTIYTKKIASCKDCEFYNYVCLQEEQDFQYALP